MVFLLWSSYALSQFTFNINAVEITGCDGICDKNLVIPNNIAGNPVTSIAYAAFGYSELTSVVIPPTVISIGEDAFIENQLTYVDIPDSVKNIGMGAFDANQLESLTFGESVMSIGDYSFIENRLTEIDIPDSVLYIRENAFRENNLHTVTFGNNVKEIMAGAFRDNQLSCVSMPDSVVEIDPMAFMNNELTSVVIPHNVDIVGDFAFYNDYSNRHRFQLDSVHFKGNRPIIGSGAFSSENPNFSLNRVTYCSNKSGWPGAPIQGITPELDPLCVTPPVTPPVCPIVSTPVSPPVPSPVPTPVPTPVPPPVCPIVSPMGYTTFDIDQNGSVDALSDGLILLRYFFGLRDGALVNDVVSPDASTTSAADIEAYIESHMP